MRVYSCGTEGAEQTAEEPAFDENKRATEVLLTSMSRQKISSVKLTDRETRAQTDSQSSQWGMIIHRNCCLQCLITWGFTICLLIRAEDYKTFFNTVTLKQPERSVHGISLAVLEKTTGHTPLRVLMQTHISMRISYACAITHIYAHITITANMSTITASIISEI